MQKGYFHRVNRLSPTRLWINNPTPREAEAAIEAGAISCTTNPTYGSKQLGHPETREETMRLIREAVFVTEDDDRAADLVTQRLVRRILERFDPLFAAKPGEKGFVSIQGNPFLDEDPDNIVSEARAYRRLGRNFIAKIPVTEAGLAAIERLVAEDTPIIATEVMGLPQTIAVCESYQRVAEKSGRHPPFYLTHITGIFDEYLNSVAREQGVDIPAEYLWQAGCIVARRQYQLLKERGYPGIMLGGGARDLHHFTEMVGGEVHVTINWQGTANRLIEEDPPVVWRMFTPAPPPVVEELLAKLPDFRRAYLEDGLAVDEFKGFGPVQHFRNSFLKGWCDLREAIAAVRQTLRVGTRA